jgi:ribosomal protein L18
VLKGKSYSVEISNLSDSQNTINMTGIYSDEEEKYMVSSESISIGTAKAYTFTALVDSIVHVGIKDITAKNHNNYTIVATQETGHGHTHDPKTYEPNSSGTAAYPIPFNQDINTSLDAKIDYQDAYVIDAKQGASYSIKLSNKDTSYSAINVRVVHGTIGDYLVNANAHTDSQNTNSDYDVNVNTTKAWTFANDKADSKVYIYIWSDDKAKQNDYTISINSNDENLTHNNTTLEPNDSSGSAYPIEINKPHNGILTGKLDFKDVYIIDGKAGYSYTLDLINKATSFSAINVQVVHENSGTTLVNANAHTDSTNNNSDYDVNINYTKAWKFDAGSNDSKIYVYLWSNDLKNNNDYIISVNSNDENLTHDSQTLEPNQLKPDAYTLLSNSTTETIDSQLEALDSYDSFKFNAPAVSKYKLTLTNKEISFSAINVQVVHENTGTTLVYAASHTDSTNNNSSYDVNINYTKAWSFENTTGNPTDIYIKLWANDKTKQNDYTFTLEKIEE